MKFSSQLLEQAVQAFSGLPGVGKKSALRLALHLVNQDEQYARQFSKAIVDMREGIRSCEQCHNLSDRPLCTVCEDTMRDGQILCVVESIRDVMAIEDTAQFRGRYHVLGGIISPLDGVGPSDLNITSLTHRIEKEGIKEIVMAISPTIEGETTIYYISKQLVPTGVRISTIARGVSFGGELEYADEITLGRSIVARVPYHQLDK